MIFDFFSFLVLCVRVCLEAEGSMHIPLRESIDNHNIICHFEVSVYGNYKVFYYDWLFSTLLL